ncbi:MAG: hypothetical protein Q9215_003923 [Flavoplaca cf. flavocitrina]
MTEVLFDDDDDDYTWLEDPYHDADDLAEHTMQSPVFINQDLVFDIDGDWQDWQDWSETDDDFYDQATSNKKRRKLHHPNDRKVASSTTSKYPKAASIKGLPQLSLDEPASACSDEDNSFRNRSIVRWKVRRKSPESPLLEHGEQEKVSILKDWKKRFKLPPSREEKGNVPSSNGAQRAVAVVIETRNNLSVPTGSNQQPDLDNQALESTTTLSHRNKTSNLSGNAKLKGSCPPKQNGVTGSRKRKLSPSPETTSGPVPKRQSIRQSDAVGQRKVIAQAGQKRRAHEVGDDQEPQDRKAKTKRSNDNATKDDVRPKHTDDTLRKAKDSRSKPSNNSAAKENARPKLPNTAATKKENTKSKSSGNAATKENVQPKASAMERRSTRRK